MSSFLLSWQGDKFTVAAIHVSSCAVSLFGANLLVEQVQSMNVSRNVTQESKTDAGDVKS